MSPSYPLLEWTVEEVVEEIRTRSWATESFLNTLADHEIDGAAFAELTKEDLKEEFGIRELGRVKRVLREVAQLCGDYVPHPPLDMHDAQDSDICSEDLYPDQNIPPSPLAAHKPSHPPVHPPAVPKKGVQAGKTRPHSALTFHECKEVRRVPQRPSSAHGRCGFDIGILETERRYAELAAIFYGWVKCYATESLRLGEVLAALSIYFSWDDEEKERKVAEVGAFFTKFAKQKQDLKQFGPQTELGVERFIDVFGVLTEGTFPAEFDDLVIFLKSCIERTSKLQENCRRERLVNELFLKWDYDSSGKISEGEYMAVIRQFMEVTRELDADEDGRHGFSLESHDIDGDGSLDVAEFTTLILEVWNVASVRAKEFDLKYFRLTCVVDNMILAHLHRVGCITSEGLLQISKAVACSTPVVLYGQGSDPSRAVEEAAFAENATVMPVLVTRPEAEKEAVQTLLRSGLGRGRWVYVVIGHAYDADALLRDIGRCMQTTNTWMIHPKSRLLISYPQKTTANLPCILSLRSIQVSVTKFDIESVLLQIKASGGQWIPESERLGCISP